ncbi:MAG TPA: hypothetical protein VEA99_05830 [Gemmatimonadaceae bacterium]|nr:hypothetical protein [Gemmatimonadaceae bacterium]
MSNEQTPPGDSSLGGPLIRPPSDGPPIAKAEGSTEAERYLGRLAERSFLSLWTYPALFRDQGGGGASGGDGKELADLVVVFGRDVVVFSDKDCAFPNSGRLEIDWRRWFRAAVAGAAAQAWGAERWLRKYPDRIFLDRACTRPFPFAIPSSTEARYYRIVVAHATEERRRRAVSEGVEECDAAGLLAVRPGLRGDPAHTVPFAIGDLDPARGFVHVLDDVGFDALLSTLDTATDLLEYLRAREAFVRSDRLDEAASESALLGDYHRRLDERGANCFTDPGPGATVSIGAGEATAFSLSPERRRQIEADRVSYAWDALIEDFARDVLGGTLDYASRPQVGEHEPVFRHMAAEPRLRRRILGAAFQELRDDPATGFHIRLVAPQDAPPPFRAGGEADEPWYLFLKIPRPFLLDETEYRRFRRETLITHVFAVRHLHPNARNVIGIATEEGSPRERSYDAGLLDVEEWTPQLAAYAAEQYGLSLLRPTEGRRVVTHKFPPWTHSSGGT